MSPVLPFSSPPSSIPFLDPFPCFTPTRPIPCVGGYMRDGQWRANKKSLVCVHLQKEPCTCTKETYTSTKKLYIYEVKDREEASPLSLTSHIYGSFVDVQVCFVHIQGFFCICTHTRLFYRGEGNDSDHFPPTLPRSSFC